MKNKLKVAILSVVLNIASLPVSLFFLVIGIMAVISNSDLDGERTINTTELIIGISHIVVSILLPIGVNYLLRIWHKKNDVSRWWSIIPAIIISSVTIAATLYYVLPLCC